MDILLIGIVLFATVIGAICGIGGGVIIKPFFDLLTNLEPATISFYSSCTVLSMSLYSVIDNLRKKSLNVRENIVLAIFSAFGGILGGRLFQLIKNNSSAPRTVSAVQSMVLLILVIMVIIYTLNKSRIKTLNVSELMKGIVGFVLGTLSSFLGIGGGPINVAAINYFMSKDSKAAAKVSLFVIVFGQTANLVSTLVTKSVPVFDVKTLLTMIVLGITGAIIGKAINSKMNDRAVDKLFLASNVLIAAVCLYNFIRFIR